MRYDCISLSVSFILHTSRLPVLMLRQKKTAAKSSPSKTSPVKGKATKKEAAPPSHDVTSKTNDDASTQKTEDKEKEKKKFNFYAFQKKREGMAPPRLGEKEIPEGMARAMIQTMTPLHHTFVCPLCPVFDLFLFALQALKIALEDSNSFLLASWSLWSEKRCVSLSLSFSLYLGIVFFFLFPFLFVLSPFSQTRGFAG